ncbi:nuclear transport factor 2 family protein [Streptacidiphilus cavernicola]|uniref:Nuclear transport factor 2 family protein n=1 Tax=Streptacidiphilus cavernicola TaxID=3342716 RepID=A0ABV6VP75_9ACTN
MPASVTPREVFEQLIGRIAAGKWGDIAELYAEDADVEVVFAPVPPRRVHGRAELRERFVELGGGDAIRLNAEDVHVHATDDPEVVIAEFVYQGLFPATGRSFRTANIQVLRVRDGLIVETRDYHDHLALAVAGGGADRLLAALDQDALNQDASDQQG